MRKWLRNLGVLLALLLISSVLPQHYVHAATNERVTIRLHKKLFDQGETPDDVVNNGKSDPFVGGEPQNGAEFAVYDVSEAFWAEKPKNKTEIRQAQEKLAQDDFVAGTPLKRVTTAGEGTASFTDLKLKHGSHYAVYLFRETATPAGLTRSQNMVVVLPITDKGTAMTPIEIYPKAELRSETIALDKTITNGRQDFDYGEAIPYRLQITVPADIGTMRSFILTDQAAQELTRVGSLEVQLDGQTVSPPFYQVVSTDAHHFKLSFDVDRLIPYANQQLTVDYQMFIEATVAPDARLFNQTTLYPGSDDPLNDATVVTTSGKNFVKVDLKQSKKHLAGAQFIVSNQAGQYLAKTTTGWRWQTVAQPSQNYRAAGLYTLTSDHQGKFALTGLKAGDYQLHEVVAPKHYQLSKKAVSFTIINGEFSDPQAQPLAIANLKEPTKTKPNQPKDKGTKKKTGRLPQAGEQRALWAGVTGLLLLALVLTLVFKRKKQTH